ncbi:MAG: hypothetical protein V4543_18445 [Bacteroidota bacterium]
MSVQKERGAAGMPDSKTSNDTVRLPKTMFINDSSLYSESFIRALKDSPYPSVKLIDNLITVDGSTEKFPETPELNKEYCFKGIKGARKYKLTVNRTLLTTIRYSFEVSEKGKLIFSKGGIANLGFFFLGYEFDTDELENTAYGAVEYANDSGSCWQSVRIAQDKDEHGKMRARFIICEDALKPHSITLDLTLRAD